MAVLNQPDSTTLVLEAGHRLTVIADSGSTGVVLRLGDNAGDDSQGQTAIAVSTTTTFGPFVGAARYRISCTSGFLTYSTARFEGSDADLSVIGALSPSNDDFLQRKAGAWANRTVLQVKSDLSLNRFGVARATYSFAVSGGVQGTITPTDSDTIPDNAIIVAVTINSTTAVTSAGAATVAIGTSAGSSTTALKGATAKTSYSADALLNGVPVFATPIKMTAAGTITFTIADADLTAGVIEVFVLYFLPAA